MLLPMLADSAIRLASGLAALLLATPVREVPPGFFRTHCQVILGLLVLAALDLARSNASGPFLSLAIASAVLSYLATVAWGLGLPRVAAPLTALIALAGGALLVAGSRAPEPTLWALAGSARLASSFLLGSTLSAMLLGHHYLTAPSMSIDPLRRFVRCMAWALAARSLVAAWGIEYWLEGRGTPGWSGSVSSFFLAIRWGMGVLGPALATVLAWKTVQIRSTQSATGILYIAMTLVLFGELTALILSRDSGIAF